MVEGGWGNTHFFLGISMIIETKSNLYTWVAPIKLFAYTETFSLKICILQLCKNNCLQTAKQDYGLKFAWQKKVGSQKLRQYVMAGPWPGVALLLGKC